MNIFQSIAKGARKIGFVVKKESPVILTVIGAGGVITTAVFAVKATPKAMQLIEQKKALLAETENQNPDDIKLSAMETVETCWKVYLPSVLMGGVSIASIVGASHINLRRNAALASLCSLTEKTLHEYQAKVIEQIGENKERKVHEALAKEKLEAKPASTSEVVLTGKGEDLCYDVLSGRYFKNDIENLRRIMNDINQNLIQEMYVSLNEVYHEMGLAPIKMGYDVGWTVDEMLHFNFTTMLSDDGRPTLVIDYEDYPKYSFNKIY